MNFFKTAPPIENWRDGVFLVRVKTSSEADIIESKLSAENIPYIRKSAGAGNAVEIITGSNNIFESDIYVPESALEDSKAIIVPFAIDEDFDVGEYIE